LPKPGQDPLPSVAVVVPTRDRADLLARSLDAVLADEATTEAVVVVDGSDPETAELLGRLAQSDKRVRITSTPAEPAELGRVQRARDHGVSLADSEVVLSMDDDVVAEPGLVSGHARHHLGTENLVVVGYMPVATPRRWPRTHAQILHYAEAYEHTVHSYAEDRELILRNLWGGNFSLRRADWLRVIDGPRLNSYLDDKELGLRLLRQGLSGEFDSSLRAEHFYERSLRGLVERDRKNAIAQTELRAAFPEGEASVFDAAPSDPAMQFLIRLSSWAPSWFVVKWGLIALTSAAAALRIAPLERRGVTALSMLAWTRTARSLLDTRSTDPTG
jgi:glycosyltransferase involved in cell wall biosynthesis